MQGPIVLRNCGSVDPESIDSYLDAGGFSALRKALLRMEPEGVVAEVKESDLLGRGGAAFPTGLKWEMVAGAPGPRKFVVCNADESEPGTFKDRAILEGDPFKIVEAVTVAGYAVGAGEGYIYVRGEYAKAASLLENAVERSYRRGFLGEDIEGSGFSFHMRVKRGAGAYVCGEETALFESIEGKRGEPRAKPPFPTKAGLWGCPTVINNVETLANIPFIVMEGGARFRRIGTERSTGTKLFPVSGRVARPGLYEQPMGISLRRLIYDVAGGTLDGRELRAVLCGGAAGVFLTPEHLDLPLVYYALPEVGPILGSGAVTVFDDESDMWEALEGVCRFFAHESCGKCTPCQIGTQRQLELVRGLRDGGPADRALLRELGTVMADASLCGLGQSASSAVLSFLDRVDGR